MTVDFELLFATLPDAYLVVDAHLTIAAANDAYLAMTMTTRDGIVGRPVFDVFPGDPSTGGTEAARSSFERVVREKVPHTLGDLCFPIHRSGKRDGALEERWWRVMNTPILDHRGEVSHVLHHAEDITEMRRLRRENELSTRYRALLDGAPDAIVIVDGDGRILLVNRQTEALFGHAREELVGQPLDLLLPERLRAQHRSHLERFFRDPAARAMGSGLELLGLTRAGREIPIEVSLSPSSGPEGTTVSAAIRDVGERRRLEAAASLNAERLASAVASIEDAVALFDAADRLVLANRGFLRLVHATSEAEVVGAAYTDILDRWLDDVDFVDDDARSAFRARRLDQRQHAQATFDVPMRDGRSLRVIDRRTPEGGIVKTVWDLTDDERRAAELREARRIAEAASAAKSDFLASMSHELRTPLNAILGFAQLLARDKREPLSERHKDRATQILRGGRHLLSLIDDILDLARIESGVVGFSLEPVDLLDVLTQIGETLAPLAARAQVTLIPATTTALPWLHADRTRLSQIVMNLASNAIKYNRPRGTVTFTVEQQGPKRVRLTVTDTGIGIPESERSRLFHPFQRAGQETGPIEGTGIGLVITKRLVELMSGDVGFRSVTGEGSSFWIELPVHDGALPSVGGAPAVAPPRASAPSSSGEHLVLYVEDNPANVAFMRDLVASVGGFELLTAPDAEVGLDLARSRMPEVIIMDINLPGMSGFEALAVLRATPALEHIPVIALTASASERDRQRGANAGFRRYLTKPVDVEAMVEALEQLTVSKPAAS